MGLGSRLGEKPKETWEELYRRSYFEELEKRRLFWESVKRSLPLKTITTKHGTVRMMYCDHELFE